MRPDETPPDHHLRCGCAILGYDEFGQIDHTGVDPTSKRFDTPVTFSPEEARAVVLMLQNGEPLRCPRCASELDVRGPIPRRGRPAARIVYCGECHRSAIVTDKG